MGLLDQFKAYIDANTPRSTRPAVSPQNVIYAGLLQKPVENIKANAAGLLGEMQRAPQDLAALASPQMYAKALKAMNTPQPVDKQKWIDAGMELSGMAPVGGLAAIVSPQVAKGLNTAKHLPDDDIFKAAVANTPGAQIDDAGLLMRVQRNQMPEQAMQPSVRGGVFYLPEGAAQAKHYSTGKSGYGGSEKIAGETLVSNPLFAKGGTGGKAPEAAYDQLIGKGAYQAMRTDALKSYGRYGASNVDKVNMVEEFLRKYAPELEGQGYYIVQNSKQGNQLAYALQEAAVGSAVRNAGHDAVLGYSKGKAGPFISELFDVRESAYPDKFGGYQLWDSFLP